MHALLRNLSTIAFLALLAVPFNNCSYTDTSIVDAEKTSSSSGLSITIEAANPLYIDNQTQVFTITGACNTGRYSESAIYWTLRTMSEQFVSDSSTAGQGPFIATCISGRYTVDVRVPCPGLINNENNCYGLLEPLRLRSHLSGMGANAQIGSGDNVSSSPVTLSP